MEMTAQATALDANAPAIDGPGSTLAATAFEIEKLVPETLEKLFGKQAYRYDLDEGTVVSLTDARMIYLSTDLIRGIYQALEYETGDAWKIVLKNCGRVWGKRVAQSLRSELRIAGQESLDDLPVGDYLALIESYIANHGWGRLVVHLDDAESHGIVRASLVNSLFVNALDNVKGPVDFMLAGMLCGMFEAVSGYALDCVQVSCERTSASKTGEFLISAADRISAIETAADDGLTLEAALEKLRAV